MTILIEVRWVPRDKGLTGSQLKTIEDQSVAWAFHLRGASDRWVAETYSQRSDPMATQADAEAWVETALNARREE